MISFCVPQELEHHGVIRWLKQIEMLSLTSMSVMTSCAQEPRRYKAHETLTVEAVQKRQSPRPRTLDALPMNQLMQVSHGTT